MQFLVPFALEQRMLAVMRLEPHAEFLQQLGRRLVAPRSSAQDPVKAELVEAEIEHGAHRFAWHSPAGGSAGLKMKRISACPAVASVQRSDTWPISRSSVLRTTASVQDIARPVSAGLLAHIASSAAFTSTLSRAFQSR